MILGWLGRMIKVSEHNGSVVISQNGLNGSDIKIIAHVESRTTDR